MFDLFITLYGYIYDLFTVEIVEVLNESLVGVIDQIAPLFLAGFSIYVILQSANWLREGADENIIGTFKSWLGWLLIIAFAFNSSNYMMIATILYELPDKLGAVFMNVDFEDTSPFTEVLVIINDITRKFKEAADDLPWYQFPLADMFYFYWAGTIIQVCALALFILVFAFYLIAKISLLLTLFLGPIFIGFLLYPSTRQYGMNWIGQCLNYTFTILLYILANGLILKVSIHVFDEVNQRLPEGRVEAIAAMYTSQIVLVITILLFFVIFNIPSIASSLTGGAGVSASGGMRVLMAIKSFRFMRSVRSGGSISKR